jgi:hypothetical protein
MLRAMSRFATWWLSPFCVGLLACSSAGDGAASGSAVASATPPPSAKPSASAAPARPPPDDLDAARLDKALGCGGAAKTGPCKVVAALADCKEWDGIAPSGDGRWLGRGYLVEDGKTTEMLSIVRSRSVPTSDVAAGQIPARFALAKMTSDAREYDAANKAIRALERHDVPQKGNIGITYVKDLKDFNEVSGMHTVRKHVVILGEPHAFVCKGPSQQLFMVQPRAEAQKGEGLYAELWPAAW